MTRVTIHWQMDGCLVGGPRSHVDRVDPGARRWPGLAAPPTELHEELGGGGEASPCKQLRRPPSIVEVDRDQSGRPDPSLLERHALLTGSLTDTVWKVACAAVGKATDATADAATRKPTVGVTAVPPRLPSNCSYMPGRRLLSPARRPIGAPDPGDHRGSAPSCPQGQSPLTPDHGQSERLPR